MKIRLIIFLLFVICNLRSAFCDLALDTATYTNCTRTNVTINGSLTGTNGTTNAVNVILYWGQTDGSTNATSWIYAITNSYTSPALPLALSTNLYNLYPSTRYYFRWYASEGTGSLWSSYATNCLTLAGTPTNDAPTVPYTPVMTTSNGVLATPTNFFTANTAAGSNGGFMVESQYATGLGSGNGNKVDYAMYADAWSHLTASTGETNGQILFMSDYLTGAMSWMTLGTAATSPVSAFATSAQGALADNWSDNSNNVFWLDGRYSGNNSTFGSGLSIGNIGGNSAGASQHGKKEAYSTENMTIGNNAHGAWQRGYVVNDADMIIADDSYGSAQLGYVNGLQSTMYMSGKGSLQLGSISASIIGVTNIGNGSIQLFNLTNDSQVALMTGNASFGLGATVVSNNEALVVGDGEQSHGDETITVGNSLWVGDTKIADSTGPLGNGAGLTNSYWTRATNTFDGTKYDWGTNGSASATYTNLIIDGAYHQISLTNVVPLNVKRVAIKVLVNADTMAKGMILRPDEVVATSESIPCQVGVTNFNWPAQGILNINTNSSLAYRIDTGANYTFMQFVVLGGWYQ